MEYVNSDSSINTLSLSVRSFNALVAVGIATVGLFIKLSEREILDIKNLGAKSRYEIVKLQHNLRNGNADVIFTNPTEKERENQVDDHDGAIISMTETIDVLQLSVRSYNCLKKNGITTLAQLNTLSVGELLSMRNLGMGSANEILDKIEIFKSKLIAPSEVSLIGNNIAVEHRIEEIVETLLNDMKKYFVLDSMVCKSLLFNLTRNFCLENTQGDVLRNEAYIRMVFMREYFEVIGLTHILSILEKSPHGITVPKIIMLTLPEYLRGLGIIEHWISKLAKNQKICYTENGIKLYKPRFIDFVNAIADERTKSIILGRINGKTLEELGNVYSIQRERVRQIEAKQMKKCPAVEEDRFQSLFTRYDLDDKAFLGLTQEPFSTHYYLSRRYERGTKILDELINDDDFSVEIRKAADRIVYRSHIYLGNVRMKKTRDNLIVYVLKTFFTDEGTYDNFLWLYEEFLKENNLHEDDSLRISSLRTLSNKLAVMNTVLWKQNQRLRYYDIGAYDFAQLFEGLNLTQYKDVEISARRFFLDNPELMRMYDIRDDYELHNLLKKIMVDVKGITFQRMPTIEFGKVDRVSQMLDLLIELAPVGSDELARAYEDKYGVRIETVKANYLKEFDDYYHDGKYVIDTPLLNASHQAMLTKALTSDFYLYSEIRDKYKEVVSDADVSLINPYIIKSLGFRTYSNYAIKSKFSSATDCFERYLFESDIVDLRLLPKGMEQMILFKSLLAQAKNGYRIIEFAHKQFINIRRLKSKGINAEYLKEYCDAVYLFLSGQDFFTVKFLRCCGFEHTLHELGFGDIFYSSLISQDGRFASNTFGTNVVFAKDKSYIQAIDFFEHVLIEQRSIDIYDFNTLLKDEYGVFFDIYKIKQIIGNSTMHYDDIMEKLYINYDQYFEEV